MYVTIEKLAHGVVRRLGKPDTLWTAFNRFNETKGDWTEKGYTLLENIPGQAIILDDTKAIGTIQIMKITT